MMIPLTVRYDLEIVQLVQVHAYVHDEDFLLIWQKLFEVYVLKQDPVFKQFWTNLHKILFRSKDIKTNFTYTQN